MTLIPGLTVVKKPGETYLIVRESDGDRELNASECELLAKLAGSAPHNKRNAFYSSAEYRNMTTAEKCAVQGDGFINDYD